MSSAWSTAERQIAGQLLAAALPGGRALAVPDESVLAAAQVFIAGLDDPAPRVLRALLWSLELGALARYGARFCVLPPREQQAALAAWQNTELARPGLRALLAPLKLAYFGSKSTCDALGCRFMIEPPAPAVPPRWREQIFVAGQDGASLELECDVVVVGTGAGGAPVAAELAARGYAVVILEEGRYFARADFTGRAAEMMRKLYRRGGTTMAYGNTVIPIPVGKAVGGTTIINNGTCFRAPESALREWRDLGLTDMRPQLLDPYYARVEETLGVAPATKEALGQTAAIIARGAEALGWSHAPLLRNAPGCDGQGLCCFGCPTAAKRSTDVSYIPRALERAAQLHTGVRVERVTVAGDTAIGVEGVAVGRDGEAVPVRVRAGVVVLACGSLHTPALLLHNGLCNASGELGRNLSIHPASSALALFDEDVHSWHSVPQGYGVDEWQDEGILLEGASTPLEIAASTHAGHGPEFMHLMERFNQTVSFGFLIKDSSRGRVYAGPRGEPRITYWLNRADVHRMQRGFALLAKLYFAAGAREVHLQVTGIERLTRVAQIDAVEAARLDARAFDVSAYHPLGTCRMGSDPWRSVVDPTHETHDVHNLFVCDGSALPGALGVNPQLTIMAFALRAAEYISRRLELRLAKTAA